MKKTARQLLALALFFVLVITLSTATFALSYSDWEGYSDDRYVVSWSLTLNTLSANATLDVFDDELGVYITDEVTTSIYMTHEYYPYRGSTLRTVTTSGVFNSTRKTMSASVSYTTNQAYLIHSAVATYRTTVPASYNTQTFTATSPLLELIPQITWSSR